MSHRQVSVTYVMVSASVVRTKDEGGVSAAGSQAAKRRKARRLQYIQEAKWDGQILGHGGIALGDIGGVACCTRRTREEALPPWCDLVLLS